ncbi:sterol desaturase family protein [Gemmatimonas groenlandica]|uniref:Sterol desaturase family protein n=1 Tax=Gemmatimonas groenlandica TaxID=2732249 RepID=A0A6M4IJM0_9BACT|nr:sterol desaturase family protein [Gemmatimonas groenlandica]QJR34265.1 sterol desaturase family protein [Gemmatimonas groenlandica]
MIDAVTLASWRAPASIGVMSLLFGWETAQPFLALFARAPHPWRTRLRHAATNIGIGVLNGLAIRFGFLALWIATMQWAATAGVGLLQWLSVAPEFRWIVVLFLLDAWTYAWHRLNHTVSFFWRFHRLHHSDRAMDVTTANRFHFGEITLSSLARVPILALIGCGMEELALYEVLLFAVVQFHHANIGLPDWIDGALRTVIVTPHLHKVHHSVVIAEQNANFSSLFSWWDRIAQTFRLAPDLSQVVFGVDHDSATEPHA